MLGSMRRVLVWIVSSSSPVRYGGHVRLWMVAMLRREEGSVVWPWVCIFVSCSIRK